RSRRLPKGSEWADESRSMLALGALPGWRMAELEVMDTGRATIRCHTRWRLARAHALASRGPALRADCRFVRRAARPIGSPGYPDARPCGSDNAAIGPSGGRDRAGAQ